MNFYTIIYNGINNTNNKGNLKAYFIREFKKAERDNFYNTDDFFNPLLQSLQYFKKELNKKFEDGKKWLESSIQKASRNELDFYDNYQTQCIDLQGVTYEEFQEQENKKWFKEKTKALVEFEIDKVKTTRNIPSLTFAQVELIENGLKDAKKEFENLENKSFNVDDFSFSADILIKSKEDFKTFLFERYGDNNKSDDLELIVDKFYGENTESIRQEAQEKTKALEYINSLDSYEVFKKSMEDSNSNFYRHKLSTNWAESHTKDIEENGLQEISSGQDGFFNEYLDQILTIYWHVFNYKEHEKGIGQISGKRARFDKFMNRQTNILIENLKKEKVKGNYKLVLDRKDYVLGLFTSLEKFLENASINISKSPFLDIFTTCKKKIKNCISFEEIKLLASLKEQSQPLPLPPQQNKEETIQEQPTFINKFDNIQPCEVYKYFKTCLVEKGYLTEQELKEYFKTAFELKTIPETLFKLKHTPTKQSIYTVFYTYYKDIAGKRHEQQTRYVELLGNYFEGYNTKIIKTNWAREYKAKR